MSVHVVRAGDPALRSRALEQLVDELLGADDRSIALFQRIQTALARHSGPATVYVELPRAGSGSTW